MESAQSVIANRSSLSEQVRNHILARIATGQFPPGHKIVEARIAEELHVSTIPVREAIRELVAKRVLEYLVHRGSARPTGQHGRDDRRPAGQGRAGGAGRAPGRAEKLIPLVPQLRAFAPAPSWNR